MLLVFYVKHCSRDNQGTTCLGHEKKCSREVTQSHATNSVAEGENSSQIGNNGSVPMKITRKENLLCIS